MSRRNSERRTGCSTCDESYISFVPAAPSAQALRDQYRQRAQDQFAGAQPRPDVLRPYRSASHLKHEDIAPLVGEAGYGIQDGRIEQRRRNAEAWDNCFSEGKRLAYESVTLYIPNLVWCNRGVAWKVFVKQVAAVWGLISLWVVLGWLLMR